MNWFWPVSSGAEVQAYGQGAELTRRGHQVSVLTRHVSGRPRRERHGGLEIYRLVNPVEMGPAFGASFVAQGAWRLWRLSPRFQIVHTHQGLWEACAAGLIRGRLGRPVLVQPAAGGWYGEMQVLQRTRGQRWLRRLILQNDHFAAISQEIAEELEAIGVPRHRISLMASGVDTERFSPGRSELEDRLAPRPRVLFVGRLHPQKNLPMLFHAWKALLSEAASGPTSGHQPSASQSSSHPATSSSADWPAAGGPSLLLVGDGPERQQLVALSERLGIAGSVHFLGKTRDVLPYLRASDAFVLPSHAEGSSNALLEAMATGVTCVVSAIGGNVDLVEDQETGLLVSADDVGGWVSALRQVLKAPTLMTKLGRAAREWIVKHRSLPAVVDQYEVLYRELIRRGSGPAR